MTVFLFIEAREIECSVINDIRHRGLSPILFTSRYLDESHFYHGIDLKLFDGVYCVDTFDSVTMLDCIRHNGMSVMAVLGSYDEVMIPAAEVAQALGLPSPDLGGLRCALNQQLARATLNEKGYALPLYRFFSVESTPLLPTIPFPFIIKPARATDANHAFICRNAEHYRHAMADIAKGQRSTLGNEPRHYIMEQFIEGPCYGAELLYNDGHWQVIAVNRRFVCAGDRPYVTGIGQPSDLDPEHLAMASTQIQCWVEALELRGGALSVVFIYAADGPVLVEITLGIAHARVIKQVELTTGINMMLHLVDFVCGLERPLNGSLNPRYPYVADAFIFSPRAGQLDESRLDKTDRYFITSSARPPTTHSMGAGRGSGAFIVGDLMAYGESCQQAMSHALTLVAQVGVKPGP